MSKNMKCNVTISMSYLLVIILEIINTSINLILSERYIFIVNIQEFKIYTGINFKNLLIKTTLFSKTIKRYLANARVFWQLNLIVFFAHYHGFLFVKFKFVIPYISIKGGTQQLYTFFFTMARTHN